MRFWSSLLVFVAAGLLAGCDMPDVNAPQANLSDVAQGAQAERDPRPAPGVTTTPPAKPTANTPQGPLRSYYLRLQNDLLARGRLRSDDGLSDAPFDAAMLERNFRAIALREEYARGQGLTRSDGAPTTLGKWQVPVRITASFGDTIPAYQVRQDQAVLIDYTARLARVTGHPIRYIDSADSANFHVLFVAEDDLPGVGAQLRTLVPRVNPETARLFDRLPREVQCMVLSFPVASNSSALGTVVALVRAELPGLMRRACIHEEIAQGLGLGNDSDQARPSIFNDDDEFALLTAMDEALLQILYDPALTPGMTEAEAMPRVRQIAQRLAPPGLG